MKGISYRSIPTIAILWAIQNFRANAQFTYPDFNQTLGLVMNGDAATTTCSNEELMMSAMTSGGEMQGLYQKIVTESGNDNLSVGNVSEIAKFGHRASMDAVDLHEIIECKTRIRLTPSRPSRVGSVWYEKRLPVLTEFDTTFKFQLSGQSRTCTFHRDPTFSLKRHKSCTVHGGDGFAFVIHADPSDVLSIGGKGKQLGYGGLKNSIAVEFDTWTNTQVTEEFKEDDLFHDHISIHSAGIGPNGSDESTSLGYSRPVDLADGKIHQVRVRYFPFLQTKYFEGMSANENLLPYLKDNGEGRRLGTLAVYIDGGIKADSPVLAIPLNLSILLDLPDSIAYVGFTAATGLQWQKHDIISWNWCDSSGCL
mmetsp:Transcript_16123/g.25137  ORF Transcript_16123/g.25137 Transcript_16123/m.25137 type:complete len:367 (-) Transcript_16123:26-1126(-)